MNRPADQLQASTTGQSPVTRAFLEHSSFIRKYLRRFFRQKQDIEDVAQEAFLRAYIAEQSKGIDEPKAFLFSIAKNVALNKLSAKSAEITDYIADLAPSVVIHSEPSAEADAESQQTLGLYCEAVAALPPKCREAYLLRKVHGLGHKEIAERMGVSLSSVEKYLLKGILACRDYVNERESLGTGVLPSSSQPKGRGRGAA